MNRILFELDALLDNLYKILLSGEILHFGETHLYLDREGEFTTKLFIVEFRDGSKSKNLKFYEAIELIIEGSL